MEKEVRQLVEMGATRAQARAALNQYKDVMQAAEQFFEGKFDDIVDDDGDVSMAPSDRATLPSKPRMITPNGDDSEDDEDIEGDEDEADDDEVYDYDDDDDDERFVDRKQTIVDPYSGIFFSKDRREEVIEVEEEPETVFIPEMDETVKLMTQGQWMKGCPEGGEQGLLFTLYRALSEGPCVCPQNCGSPIIRQKKDFFALFSSFDTYIEYLQRIVPRTCTKCSKSFCYACGEALSGRSDNVSEASETAEASPSNILFHCSNLQGVILGVGLAMLEKAFLEETQETTGEKSLLAPRAGKRRKTAEVPAPVLPPEPFDNDDEDDEPFYHPIQQQGKKAKLGVGYAGDNREDMSGQMEALIIQRVKDERLAKLLTSIRTYLPCLHRPGGPVTSDYLVHPTALAHLRRRFNFVSSQLLRNDSLADMSDRSVLYFELLEWLETISCHEALASMMAMPIMVVASIKNVAAKKGASKGSHIRERTIVYEGSSGPRELLEAIVIQAQAALKGLEGVRTSNPEDGEMTEQQKRMTSDDKGKMKEDIGRLLSEENRKLLSFCQRILKTADAIDRSLRETRGTDFVERLHQSLPRISRSKGDQIHVDAGETEESAMKAYMDWANRVRFEYCDLTIPSSEAITEDDISEADRIPHYKFFYNNEARTLANSDLPKRSLAIAKELAVLTTNLPVDWNSSIFLRVDETRVDVIKVLITGPEGTPYYNGCYLFDVFLGPAYNQSPPNVKYMTTNGGKFRFNPNLYADGKVCLSLLGTWTGPGWVPGKSTLLQVLISIQSMILCEEPYLNEPGWAGSGGTPQSRAYSANIRRMVVKIAMLGNLRNPPEPFEDVIRTHYRLKARSIMKQLDQWLAQDDGKPIVLDGFNQKITSGGSSNGFQSDVEELKEELKKLMLSG